MGLEDRKTVVWICRSSTSDGHVMKLCASEKTLPVLFSIWFIAFTKAKIFTVVNLVKITWLDDFTWERKILNCYLARTREIHSTLTLKSHAVGQDYMKSTHWMEMPFSVSGPS